MQNVIELKNISAYRGHTRVFDTLSLEISQGTNTVILGPNGAGKTTLLKLLTREIYPVRSEDSCIRIFGKERWNVQDLRERLGIVSHDLQQTYGGRVEGKQVILSGYYSSIDTYAHQEFSEDDRKRADSVMDMLGITALKNRKFSAMSTGQQRRFLLGRALIHDPDTLVLDEPTSGLDLKASFQYLAIVRHLMQAGKTLVLATHHIHEIPPEISRAVLLKDGEIIADGDKSQILTGENISRLFDTPVTLARANGYYQALPGNNHA